MTAADLVCAGLWDTVVFSGAVIAVLALRPTARRLLGPEAAFGLWLVPLIALIGAQLPAPRGAGPEGPVEAGARAAAAGLSTPAGEAVCLGLVLLWAAGALAFAVALVVGHLRFMAAARAGRAGPAVVGILRPRLVTPADFSERFAPHEQGLVRAHERAHLERLDGRWNALCAGVGCLFWFNPLAHAAAAAVRLDQELACDARVLALRPFEVKAYAAALLRAHGAATPGPLACAWGATGRHPLVLRLDCILAPRTARREEFFGVALLLALALALTLPWAGQTPNRALDRPAVLYLRAAAGPKAALGRVLGGPSGGGRQGGGAVWGIALKPD